MKKSRLLKDAVIFIICGILVFGGVSVISDTKKISEMTDVLPMIILIWLGLSTAIVMFKHDKN